MLWLIDHSHHEPDLDWSRVKAEGYTAVVHKATEGTSFLDSTYARRIAKIRAAGLIPGAYHWLHSTDPVGQCRFFLDTIGSPAGMLIQLDWEDVADPPPVAVARTWIAEWRAQTGDHPVLIYLPHWFWRDHLGSPAALDDLGPLWASHYVAGAQPDASTAEARVPASWRTGYAGWSGPTVLQTTDNGQAAGVGGLDFNTFYGTLSDLLTLTGVDMTPDQDNRLTQVYLGTFFGGDSCGRPDPATGDNSMVAKLDYLMNQVDQIASGGGAVTPAPAGSNLTDADVDRIAKRFADIVSARMKD